MANYRDPDNSDQFLYTIESINRETQAAVISFPEDKTSATWDNPNWKRYIRTGMDIEVFPTFVGWRP